MRKIIGVLCVLVCLGAYGICWAKDIVVKGEASWGVITVEFDEDVRKHFATLGWYPDTWDNEASETYRSYILQIAVDQQDTSRDTKGCLRASFYGMKPDGKEYRLLSLMSDFYQTKAMMRAKFGFYDGSMWPWTRASIKWTKDCSDTGELYNNSRPSWLKK